MKQCFLGAPKKENNNEEVQKYPIAYPQTYTNPAAYYVFLAKGYFVAVKKSNGAFPL